MHAQHSIFLSSKQKVKKFRKLFKIEQRSNQAAASINTSKFPSVLLCSPLQTQLTAAAFYPSNYRTYVPFRSPVHFIFIFRFARLRAVHMPSGENNDRSRGGFPDARAIAKSKPPSFTYVPPSPRSATGVVHNCRCTRCGTG